MREIFERVEDSTTIKIEAEVDIEEHIEDYPWLYSLFVKPNNIEENSLDFERFLYASNFVRGVHMVCNFGRYFLE